MKSKGLKSFKNIFFIFILLVILNLSGASALNISVNPAYLVNGEYYIVRGSNVLIQIQGTPDEQVSLTITSEFTVASSSGKYSYFMDDFPIPIDVDFVTIRSSPVTSLKVVVKKWFLGREFSATAKNGVATINIDMSKIPISSKGNWDITISGDTESSQVQIEAKVTADVTLDDEGMFEINYDTSKLPIGDLLVNVEGNIIRAHIVESESDIPSIPTPTPTPEPTITPTPTPTPVSTPTPTPTPTSTPTPIPTPNPTPEMRFNHNSLNSSPNLSDSANSADSVRTPIGYRSGFNESNLTEQKNEQYVQVKGSPLSIPGFTGFGALLTLLTSLVLLKIIGILNFRSK